MENIPKMAVSVAVAIILIVTVAVPIISGSTDQIRTGSNNTDFIYSSSISDSEINGSVADDKTSMTINGIVYESNNPEYLVFKIIPVVLGNDFSINAYKESKDSIAMRLTIVNGDSQSIKSFEITKDSISYVISGESDKITMAIDTNDMIYLDKYGNLGVFENGKKIFVTPGSTYFIYSSTASVPISGTTAKGVISFKDTVETLDNGNIKETKTIYKLVGYSITGIKLDNLAVDNNTIYNEGEDLITLNAMNAKATVSGTVSGEQKTGDINAIGKDITIIAPINYSYIDSGAESMRTLVNLIPLLMTIGLIIGAVGYTIYRKSI